MLGGEAPLTLGDGALQSEQLLPSGEDYRLSGATHEQITYGDHTGNSDSEGRGSDDYGAAASSFRQDSGESDSEPTYRGAAATRATPLQLG
jgi:hypothetical protein